MERFPHLKFSELVIGRARFSSNGSGNEITQRNKGNREGHSQSLLSKTALLRSNWSNHISEREGNNLAPLSENIEPVFLQINPELLSNVEFNLLSFGIEIISEEENGFIVGASSDNLRTLEEKINGFITSEWGSGRVADLWQIIDGNREEWKPKHILSPDRKSTRLNSSHS